MKTKQTETKAADAPEAPQDGDGRIEPMNKMDFGQFSPPEAEFTRRGGQHSPEWKAVSDEIWRGHKLVCQMKRTAFSDRAAIKQQQQLIVRAVNNAEKLAEALKQAIIAYQALSYQLPHGKKRALANEQMLLTGGRCGWLTEAQDVIADWQKGAQQ